MLVILSIAGFLDFVQCQLFQIGLILETGHLMGIPTEKEGGHISPFFLKYVLFGILYDGQN